MEQTNDMNNAEIPKINKRIPAVDEAGPVDVDNGFSDAYIDPAQERKMMWKFDVRECNTSIDRKDPHA